MIWTPATTLPISPLVKVPLLFANSWAMKVAYTPPTPVADEKETEKYGYNSGWRHQFNIWRKLAAAARAFHWIHAICESSVIMANPNVFPSTGSADVLSVLVRLPGSASAIRVTPSWLSGTALVCAGALIRYYCYRELGRFFTWEMSLKKDQYLVTTGPYSYVRHPSYTGMLLVTIGTVLYQLSHGSWLYETGWLEVISVKFFVVVWLAYIACVPGMMFYRVFTEDQVLRGEFPAEWEAWAKKTPYRIIPFVF